MPIPNNADGGANAFTAQIRQANLAEVASQELSQKGSMVLTGFQSFSAIGWFLVAT